MGFYDTVEDVAELLQRHKRVTYQGLKIQFGLDDQHLRVLVDELIHARKVAIDDGDIVLAWTGPLESPQESVGSLIQRPRVTPLSYTPDYLARRILTLREGLQEERKQVTVLFADIKGSTELARSMDPEELHRLLDPALHSMMDAVHRYEGTINQVLGDGVMAIFGAPLAHEDHAVRACYAALEIQTAMHKYDQKIRASVGLSIQVRVGLNSGEVVVRAIGNDLHMDYSAIGHTTHLAARMEQLATPGTIALTPATLRLAQGLIRVASLGPARVKGFDDALEIFQLVRATSFRGLLQTSSPYGLTPFIGRQAELQSFQRALDKAGARQGQVLSIVGEPGVGKSRLVYEFVHSDRINGSLVLESSSVSYGKSTAYSSVITLLKAYFQIEDDDDTRTIRAKATNRVLTLDEHLQDTLPAILNLLDALPDSSPFRNLEPRQRAHLTVNSLKRLLLRESEVQPLVLVFQDLQWIDTETQTVLDVFVDSIPSAQVLLLLNYRPDYAHGWGAKTYYTQIQLHPLSTEHAQELLDSLLGHDRTLSSLKPVLIKRTEGNPFFLEETVRDLVETRALNGTKGAYQLVESTLAIGVPATVQAVLAARMDRLAAGDKHVLQVAAVIGMEVPFSLLREVTELPEDALHWSLAQLRACEFLYETTLYPEVTFAFRHVLTHEVSYGSLLQDQRRTLHAKIVTLLENFPELQTCTPDNLAHHAKRGEIWEKAFVHFSDAGAKAMLQSAFRAGMTCFQEALEASKHLEETNPLLTKAIDIRLDLRNALFMLGTFRESLVHLEQARELSERLGDKQRLGRVLGFITAHYNLTGNHIQAIEVGQHALALSTDEEDRGLHVLVNYYLGVAFCNLGDFNTSIRLLTRSVFLTKHYEHERFGTAALLSVIARTWLVRALAQTGKFKEGLLYGEEAVQIATETTDLYSLTYAHCAVGGLFVVKGDINTAILELERALRVSERGEVPVLSPLVQAPLGFAYVLQGRGSGEGICLLEEAIEKIQAMGRTEGLGSRLVLLAEAYLRAERIHDAKLTAKRALDIAREQRDRGSEASALRLLGNIESYQEQPDRSTVESYYRNARELAEKLGMLPLRAHCHLDLSLHYKAIGQYARAADEQSCAASLYRAADMVADLPDSQTLCISSTS